MAIGVQYDMRTAIQMLSVVLLGVMAGVLFGTGMAAGTARGLPEAAWTLRFQLEDALFAKTMPPLMLATLLSTVAACALGQGLGRWLFGVAALSMVMVLFVTIAREVPLNKEIQSWTAGAAPAHWAVVRDGWLANHRLRTVAAFVAFVCSVFGSSRR